ncbi:hypothetical protein [Siminovitchia fortis]|nr:hypothetical protein [Siminovitchia fortis]
MTCTMADMGDMAAADVDATASYRLRMAMVEVVDTAGLVSQAALR